MAAEKKDQRIVTMMTESEVAELDDWRFRNKIQSRGEAVRRLIQMGIRPDSQYAEDHR